MAERPITARMTDIVRKPVVLVSAVVLVASGVVIAIANKDPQPNDFDPPTVEWEEDAEWTGNPWVDAVRRSETLLAFALTKGDYTDPDLIAAVGYTDTKANAWGTWKTLPEVGTIAHASRVTSVDVAADGHTAKVSTCVWTGDLSTGDAMTASASWWVRQLETGHYQAAPALTYGDTVHRDGESAHCDNVTVRAAAWATPLEPDGLLRPAVEPLPFTTYRDLDADRYTLPVGYEPGTVPTGDDLIWFDGTTQLRGTHPLFDAYLDQYIAQSWAMANNDFSAPEVIAALGYDRAREEATAHLDAIASDAPFTARGRAELVQNPVALALVSVEEIADDAIVASICMAMPEYDRRDISKDALVELTLSPGVEGNVEVSQRHVSEDTWRESNEGAELDYPCHAAIRTFALWPEPIDTFASHERDTVMPRERSYYVDLGIIDG